VFQSVARPKSVRKRGRRRRKSVQRASERALLAGSFTFAEDHAEERADALGAALAPETTEHTDLLMGILVNGVRGRVDLIPSPGQVSGRHPLRKAIPAAELLNRDMSFEDPFRRRPWLVAGGPALNASDAGDDVRNSRG
jgi:hypothetical protein